MKQHPVNLMPRSILARSQAGTRASQYLMALIGTLIVVSVLAAQARLLSRSAHQDMLAARRAADQALANESQMKQLSLRYEGLRAHIDRYNQVAVPIDVSRCLATVVGMLPPHMSVDRIEISTGVRESVNGPRTEGVAVPDRVMKINVTGFAATDEEIAEFVMRLDERKPFENVSLDYSQTRRVREQAAREFRVSIEINLEHRYEQVAAAGSQTP